MALFRALYRILAHFRSRRELRNRLAFSSAVSARLEARRAEVLKDLPVLGPELIGVWQLELASAVSVEDWKTARLTQDKLMMAQYLVPSPA